MHQPPSKHLLTLLSCLLLLFTTQSHAQLTAPVTTELSSRHYLVDETGGLTFIFTERLANDMPPRIKHDSILIEPKSRRHLHQNGNYYYLLHYDISPQKAGTFTIPAVTFQGKNGPIQSQPIQIQAIDHSELTEHPNSTSPDAPYYSHFFLPDTPLYPHQAIPVTYKIYIPRGTDLRQPGVPSPESITNASMWRLEIPDSIQRDAQAYIDNRYYHVISYTSVLIAGEEVKDITISPLTANHVTVVSKRDPRFGFTRERRDIQTSYPSTTLPVQPYPTTPPVSFNHAVGDYLLSIDEPDYQPDADNQTYTLNVTIKGSGNLPNLNAPAIVNGNQWDIVDISRDTSPDQERKAFSGEASFTYILKANPQTRQTPHLIFTYFSPASAEFITQQNTPEDFTPSIQVPLPNAGTTAIAQPTGEQQSILALLPVTEPSTHAFSLPSWSIHLIPASLLALILLSWAWQKHQQRQTPHKDQQRAALKSLRGHHEHHHFISHTAHYIERYHPEESGTDPQLGAILAERDQLKFNPQASSQQAQASANLPPKSELLRHLRKLLTPLALLSLLSTLSTGELALASPASFTQSIQGAEEAYHAGHFREALDTYQALASQSQSPAANLHYNIANCHYRLGAPGIAALHYQRALRVEPDHPEAAANLALLYRQYGSILPTALTHWQDRWIAKLAPHTYRTLIILALWALVLAILYLLLHRRRRSTLALCLKTLAILTLLTAPILLLTCLYAQHHYPKSTLVKQDINAVVTQTSRLLSDPFITTGEDSSNLIVTVTPASPARILHTRASWTYLQLANGQRGWLNTADVEAITPSQDTPASTERQDSNADETAPTT